MGEQVRGLVQVPQLLAGKRLLCGLQPRQHLEVGLGRIAVPFQQATARLIGEIFR